MLQFVHGHVVLDRPLFLTFLVEHDLRCSEQSEHTILDHWVDVHKCRPHDTQRQLDLEKYLMHVVANQFHQDTHHKQ